MKATIYNTSNTLNKATMKNLYLKKYIAIIAVLMASVLGIQNLIAQTTVFTDDFSGITSGLPCTTNTTFTTGSATPSANYTFYNGGNVINQASVASNIFLIGTTGSNANVSEGATFPLNSFASPFNTTLSSNTGLVSWTFNMRKSSATDAIYYSSSSGRYAAFVLSASNPDLTDASCTGYMIAQVAGKTYGLFKFSAGINNTTAGNYTQIGTTSAAMTNITDYGSFKVTYNPTTDAWSFYFRNDGTTSFADPESGSLTTVFSDVVDDTYTGSSMSVFGFFNRKTTSTNNVISYDNIKVTVTASCTNPTITTGGTATAKCFNSGSQTTSLTYSATTESPTSYSINWDATANAAGLTDQGSTAHAFAGGGGTISDIAIPANVAGGTYSGTMTITNAGGCTATQAVSLTVNALPTITLGSNPSVVSGSNTADLTYSATTGSPDEYAIDFASTISDVALTTLPVSPITINTTSVADGTYNGTLTVKNTTTGCTSSGYAMSVTLAAPCSNPSITGQPSTGTQTLCVGGTPTDLTITATGATGYQWYSSADAAVGGDTNLGSSNGAQTDTYTPSTASAGALYYYCIVSDGACTTTSNLTGLITVNAAPAISAQPSNATAIISGAATSMSVTASNATGYQWQYSATSGGTYNNVADGTPTGVTYTNATTATLGITAGGTASAGTGYYKCVVSGTAPCASTTSDYGTLTISSVSAISNYETFVWKTNQTACTNSGSQTALVTTLPSITISGTGSYDAASSYNINASGEEIIFTSTKDITSVCLFGKIQSASVDYSVDGGSTYQTLTSTNTADNALYTISSFAAGAKTFRLKYTEANTLGVWLRNMTFTLSCIPPTVSSITASQTVCAGASPVLTTSATANSGGTLGYQWYNGSGAISGATSASYTATSIAATTTFYCAVAEDGCTVNSSNSVVTVNALPAISSQSTATQTVPQNGSASAMTVTATGAGLSYQWYSSTDASTSTAGDDIAVGSNSNSHTPSTTTIGTLYYYCQVSGTCTPAVKSAISGAIIISAPVATPTTQASNITFSSIAHTSMTIGWTRGNGANIAVFVKSGAGAITNPSDASTYTANTTFGSGTQLGSSGYYCVYNGTGTSVAITGLSASTTYTVQAFEYNGSGASTLYNVTTDTNNPNTQATTAAPDPYACEGFEDAAWEAIATGSGTTATVSSTTGDWYVYNSKRSTSAYAGSDCLNPSSSGSYIQSPTLNSGVGTVTFYGIYNAKTIIVQVYNSSNVLVSSETFTMTGSWAQYTHTSNSATGSYVRFLRGSDNNVRIDEVCITAFGAAPTVTTQAVTSPESTTATGNFTITDAGDGVTSSGICWSTSTNPTTANSKTTDGGTSLAAHTGNMTGLTGNTTYYVKGYATGNGGTGYGSEVTVLTKPSAPTVATESSVTSTSFVANWTAPTGGTATYTLEVDVTAGDFSSPIQTISSISSGSLSQVVSGLSASTGYKYRVIAVNATGESSPSAAEAVTTAAPAPEINVTQAGTNYLDGTSTYAYGAVTNASSADITFTIQNTGAGDLTITSTSVTGDAVFTRQTDPTGTIVAGGTATITVRFTPTSSIAFTGTLTINSDDTDEGVYTVALTGTGTSDLSAPTGLASSSPTASGFTLGYNIVSGASSGYEAKVCQIDGTPSNVINQTNSDIQAWTTYPVGKTCTDVTNYTIDYNGSTTQVTADGTYTLVNAAIISGATCPYIILGKPNQTAQVSHGDPAANYWEGGNSDITGDAVNDGGMIVFPEVASAGTLTMNVQAISGSPGIMVEKSTDGGTTFTQVGSTTVLGTSATTVTQAINEMNPVIIRIRDVANSTNYKWIRVNSFSMTNYMECGTEEVIASQATASHNFTGLNPNTIYYYTIRSKAGATYSRWSTASAATTEITLPNPPTLNATTSVTSTGMTLNWAAPASAGNQTYTYTIEYGTDAGYAGALSLTGISSGTLAQALTGLSKNTTYYYRVRCENESGVSTWASNNTATLADAPTVTTTSVSAVATTTASTGGNVTDDGGDAITDMGLAYGTSANPTTGLDEPSNTTGAFTSSLTGLTPNTTYYYRAYATNINGTSYGTESSFITLPNAPTVGTGSSAQTDGFTASWTAPGTPGTATYTYTVEGSTNAADFTSPNATATGIASGTTSYAFTGLNSFVTYYYRVKCVNAEGSSDWSAVSAGFQTAAGGATVTTSPVTNITVSGADGGGDATADGGDAITVKGLVYKTTSPVTATDNPTADGGAGTGVFASTLSGLTANTKYYYRAYATNGNGTALGTELNFTTLPDAPVIGTGNAETGVGFTANWTAPASAGTETYTYEVEVTATSGNYTTPAASYTGISSASLSQVVTGLSASTPYYYRVRATNSEGSGAWSTESAVVTTLAQKTLTVTFTNGTVTANGTPITSGVANVFSENEEITLAATPASGYGFLRWVVEGVQNVADNPYTMTLVDNTSMTANFAGAVCNTYDYDDVTDLSTSNISGNFTTDGTTWSVSVCRLNTSSTYSHSGNNSIRLSYTNGSLITPVIARPVSISFWARLYNTSYNANLRVYISTDGGTTYDATPIISESVTGSSWIQYSASVSTTSTNVKFKVVNASSSLGGTSYDLVIDDMEICEGPDATAPTLSFTPTNGSTSVAVTTTPTVTSTEALYRFNTTTGALIAITAGSLSGMHADTLATFLTLTKVSDGSAVPFTATIDGTGKIMTVTPSSSFAYATEFKLSVRNVGDANGNIIPTTIYTQFTTEVAPIAIIGVKEMSPYGDLTDGEIINMGTIISQPSTTKTFKIYNTGNAALTFTQGLATGTLFTVTTAPTSPLAAGDSTTFVITFTPVATGAFTDVYSINSNDATNPLFELNLQGGKAAFVLPYTYQSGCTSPVISASEFKHDYTSLNDIPEEITLKNGSTVDEDHFFANYSVFHVEGNCMPQGSSALRIGQDNNGMKIHLTNGCGQVTVKWCANGYRKIRISDNSSNVYELSPTYQIGGVCYTTTSVLNVAGDMYLNIEFLGTDAALLTTVYFLEITPYNADLKSSARDILTFSTTDNTENVRIYDDVVLVTVDPATNRAALATDLIQVSPFATISPAQGTTQNYSAGPVTYTVTAQNGLTKEYKVYVDAEVTYSDIYYADTVQVTVPMGSDDQVIEVIEISNPSCTVPVSGTGSAYTIYFLELEDKPASYLIGGTPLVCIGSTATYTITNAPAANNPTYTWSVGGAGASAFTVIGPLSGPTLTLKAPDTLSTADLSLGITVDFGAGCALISGTANKTIDVTDQPPAPIDGLTTACVSNGMLTIEANGSSDATTYNWNFTPSTTQVLIQTDSTIVVNVGTSASDIQASVNTQNGCGVTENTTAYDVDYAQSTSTWTGAVDADWNNPLNWTGRVPQACTNVIIPDVSQAGVAYPTISAAAACHYITFEPGAAVLGLENLAYEKAFVQAELQRNRWYTMAAPLKEMRSGDFGFMGAPLTQMTLFDEYNPDNSAYTANNWTKPFSSQSVDLDTVNGFAFRLSTKSLNYPSAPTTTTDEKALTFPRLNSDSSLVKTYIPFNSVNGKPYYANAVDLEKVDSLAYRFAAENSNDAIVFPITKPLEAGLNLIGNPMMTHLSFANLKSHNAAIDNAVKFWNGTYYATLISDLNLWSIPGDTTGVLIAPMQAFIVNSPAGGTLSFAATDFVADAAKTSVLRSTKVPENLMYVTVNNGSVTNAAAIAMRSAGANNLDSKDASKLFAANDAVAEVYTLSESKPLDINIFNKAPYTTPLGIRNAKKGNVTLNFKQVESYKDVDVYLINTQTGENVNLKENPTYSFETNELYNEGKLFIEFRNASISTENENSLANNINIFVKDNNTIKVISNPTNLIRTITVIDETGRVILMQKEIDKAEHEIVMNNNSQVYIVKVATDFENKTEKVIIR